MKEVAAGGRLLSLEEGCSLPECKGSYNPLNPADASAVAALVETPLLGQRAFEARNCLMEEGCVVASPSNLTFKLLLFCQAFGVTP